MSGIRIVKVSILGVLVVVKDLGSKEYQPRRREEKKEGMACHQKSPQYVKVVTGRKGQNIRGDKPCRSVRPIAVNTRLVRSR